MRDLFGVEVPDAPAPAPAASPLPPAPVEPARPRRLVQLRVPGSLAERLGIRAWEWTTETPAERRRARDRWLSWVHAPPRFAPTLDPESLRGHFYASELARKHVATGRIGDAFRRSAPGTSGHLHAEVLRLISEINASVYSSDHAGTSRRREDFPDPWTERDVLRGALNVRARVLEQTQTELPQSSKFRDLRYLRAYVRNRNMALYPRRSAMRKCGRRRYNRGGVRVWIRDGPDGRARASYDGVVRCGSVWSCPCCASRISSTRAGLVRQVIGAHRENGGGVYMGTFTFPHSAGMSAGTLRRVRAAAWKLMQQGAPWARLKKRMGFVGSIAAVEVTHGGNGWHPHIHVLVATRAPLDDNALADIRDALFAQWASAVARQDVARIPVANPDAFRARAVVFEPCRDDSYIQKLGLADELTRAVDKAARDGNRTPFAIMADYARLPDARDGAILREYHRAFKGARQLTWSHGRMLPCASCAVHADLSATQRRALCPTRGYHGVTDLRRIYPPAGDPLQLALLDGEDANADFLRRADEGRQLVTTIPPAQFDALVRVMTAARSDAGAELVIAAEEHGAAGVQALLESAYRLGTRLAHKRRRLRRWLWWLDPRRQC